MEIVSIFRSYFKLSILLQKLKNVEIKYAEQEKSVANNSNNNQWDMSLVAVFLSIIKTSMNTKNTEHQFDKYNCECKNRTECL
jgi:hypothetical protein